MFEQKASTQNKQFQKEPNSIKDYVRTTDQQKFQLIDLVINQKYSMKLASEIVGVKLSTVKYIVKAYKTDKQSFLQKLKPKKLKLTKQKTKQLISKQPELGSDSIQNNAIEQMPFQNDSLTPKINNQIDNGLNTYFLNTFGLFQGFSSSFPIWNQQLCFNNVWFS